MKDPRRFFTARQARQKIIACRGLCERCGCELQNGFHMHHRKPHSEGGQTVLANCDALCPKCHKEVTQ